MFRKIAALSVVPVSRDREHGFQRIVSNDFRLSCALFGGAGRFGRRLQPATDFSFDQCGSLMKRSWAGEVRNVSLLVASAVNSEGFREILGICEGAKEDKSGWSAFLRHLVDRGLKGVRLVISDACRGFVEASRISCRRRATNAAWCISIVTSRPL